MIKTPLCGTCQSDTTVTIFVGTDTCFGSVVFTNFGTSTVNVLKNGNSTTPIAAIPPGCRLALALDSLVKLELDFSAAGTVSYKGCICCNTRCCEPSCEV